MLERNIKVTFIWTLDGRETGCAATTQTTSTTAVSAVDGDGDGGNAAAMPTSPRLTAAAVAAPTSKATALRPTTSVHLAQWRAEQRARDEVLVRVRGQPRVNLNRVFEVSNEQQTTRESKQTIEEFRHVRV